MHTRTLLLCHGRVHDTPASWRRRWPRDVETMDVDLRCRPHHARDICDPSPIDPSLVGRYDLIVGMNPPHYVLWDRLRATDNDDDVMLQPSLMHVSRMLRPGGLFVTTLPPVPFTPTELQMRLDGGGFYEVLNVPVAIRTLLDAPLGMRLLPLPVANVDGCQYPARAFDGFLSPQPAAPTIDVTSQLGRQRFLEVIFGKVVERESSFDLREWIVQKRFRIVALSKD